MKRSNCRLAILVAGVLLASVPFASSQSPVLRKAQLESPRLGWALGDTQVSLTTDEGKSWSDVTPPHDAGQRFVDAAFSSEKTGVVVAMKANPASGFPDVSSLVISRTSDRGHTWLSTVIEAARISQGDCCAEASLSFADENHGWLLVRLVSGSNFSFGKLFSTSDGGKTWTALPDPPVAATMTFVTANVGWLVGGPAGSALWRTENGGHSWDAINLPHPECVEQCRIIYDQPSFKDALTGQIPVTFYREKASSVALYKTGDGGRTWSQPEVYQETGQELTLGKVRSIATPTGLIRVTGSANGTLETAISGQRRTTQVQASSDSSTGIRSAGFIDASDGWLLQSTRTCSAASGCKPSVYLLATSDGGTSYTVVNPNWSLPPGDPPGNPPPNPPPPSPPKPPTPPPPPVVTGNELSLGVLGFDVACAPSSSLMSTWWNWSPFDDVGLYIGGAHVTCVNASASWVLSASAQGWGILPIWVGLQAPPSCGQTRFSTNVIDGSSASNAYNQGTQDGAAAVAQAANFAISGIIYTDVEQYSNATCPTVQSYLQGWGAYLHGAGYNAGAYMAYANNADYNAPSLIPYIDAIWVARWNGSPSSLGITPLQYNWFAHQYCSDGTTVPCDGVPETYGSATISGPGVIDEDYDETIVAPFDGDRNLAGPALTSPINGQTGVSLTPTLSWSQANAAIYSYMVEIASDPGDLSVNPQDTSCDSCDFWDTSDDPTYVVPSEANLAAGTTYYWQVKVNGQWKWGDWSYTGSFTTATSCTVAAITVRSPDGQVVAGGLDAIPELRAYLRARHIHLRGC